MPFKKIDISPGVNRSSTSYSVSPSWYDMNNMRFREATPESIGGWERDQSGNPSAYYFQGFGREAISSKSFEGNRYRFVGTSWKFYVVSQNDAVDVTPNRISGVTITNPFKKIANSSILNVAHTDHGLSVNDWVVFNSVAADDSDSKFTAAVLSQSASNKAKHYGFQVINVIDPNEYEVRIRDYNSDTVPAPEITAQTTESVRYGGNVVVYYKVKSGINTKEYGSGWGIGSWDGVNPSRAWNTASSSVSDTTTDEVRRVCIENYGEDVMFCNSGGPIFYYDVSANSSSGVITRSVTNVSKELSSFSGSLDTPSSVDSFLVSKRDGHCVALGCSDNDGSNTYNSMLVRWSDQNNPFDWRPTPTNTSGGQVLRSGSKIMGGVSTNDEVLIFTDSGVYSMKFIGPPLTFGFNLVSSGVEIVSAKAAVNASNSVFFMGNDGFYSYNGNINPLSSSVSKYVFDNFNQDQKDKCFASVNSSFSEVYWFYPSKNSFEVDKFVAFNYEENSWSFGSFDMSSTDELSTSNSSYSRTSWSDRSVFSDPYSTFSIFYTPGMDTGSASTSSASVVDEIQISSGMLHEKGRKSQGLTMNSFIETSYIPLGEGDASMFCSRILPDMEVFDSGIPNDFGGFTFELSGKDYPGDSENQDSDLTTSVMDASNGNHYVLNYPYPVSHNANAIRMRSRFIKMKVSSGYDWGWRIGAVRIDMKPDGLR
jgi:hypothetical protein